MGNDRSTHVCEWNLRVCEHVESERCRSRRPAVGELPGIPRPLVVAFDPSVSGESGAPRPGNDSHFIRPVIGESPRAIRAQAQLEAATGAVDATVVEIEFEQCARLDRRDVECPCRATR